MEVTTVDDVRMALRKLLSYNYYDNNDLVSRREVADFIETISSEADENDVLSKICDIANGNRIDLLQSWESSIQLAFYPKKLYSKEKKSSIVFTNVPESDTKIERLLIKSYFPVELRILDTLWVLKYGYLIDRNLDDESCWGNRLDLTANRSEVKLGDSLFHRYHQQYRKWWESGLKAANKKLKEETDVSIISFDISDCYHSIDFDFERFYKDPAISGLLEDPLQAVVRSIYQSYWQQTKRSALIVFGREVCHPLPLNLLSAHILANWFLSPIEEYIKSTFNPLYFGRYVDDCMVVCETSSSADDVFDAISQELPGMFKKDGAIYFAAPELSRLTGLSISESKLFLYRFNCQLPQPSIEDSLNDFIERSSEYRFLTEEEDPNSSSLEDVTLVNALEPVEEVGKRFNILEENKYLLSVYLSKLATQLSVFGSSYQRIEEVDKIFKYFQDSLIEKHYLMWERIFTIFVLAGRMDFVESFKERSLDVIDRISFSEPLQYLKDSDLQNVKSFLKRHLIESQLLATSLLGETAGVPTIYLDTYMLRMRYNRYPMQEFSDSFREKGVGLSINELSLKNKLYDYRWLPYYKPLFEIVSANSLKENYSHQMMKDSFSLYLSINRIIDLDRFDVFCHFPKDGNWVEFNTKVTDDEKDKLTVAVAEMDNTSNNIDKAINDAIKGIVSTDRIETIRLTLDKVTSSNADIFILPELSIPIYELNEVCRYSAKKKKACVAGLEYLVFNGEVRNYYLTCLPISLYGRKDALPVIRLKNYYAPKEQLEINKNHLKIPTIDTPWQMLYHWRGHVFTTYMCFELTSIKDRSYFISKVDAIYSSVYNPDTYYFNNIAESCSRDMHCYYIQANVSHYGDSRVTKPARQCEMNMLRVKGGNTDSNKSVVLTCEIDIKGLRDFQVKDYSAQAVDKSFKPTPPSFSVHDVKDRNTKRFVMPYDSNLEEMLAQLSEIFLKY